MKYSVLGLLLVTLLFSCGEPAGSKLNEQVAIPEEEKEVVQLSLSDIFNPEKVRLFLIQNQTENQEAKKIFLQGLDAYKNQKKLSVAADQFMASIVSYPSSQSYYELGNVCMEQKNYKMALNAYTMAEKMGYEPFSKVLYNIACAHSCLKELEESAKYLQYALQAGYTNIENIEKDPDLKNLREGEPWMYRRYFNAGMEGMSDVENLQWLQFKRQFLTKKFPFSLETDVSKIAINEKNQLSFDFERFVAEMRDERFSREVSKGFYHYAIIEDNSEYVALIYIMKEEFYESAPLTYQLVTFTNTGKILDKKIIAGRDDFSSPLKTCSFDKSGKFTITTYETIYEKDVEEHGYENNKIVSKTKLGTETYKISPKGIIQSIESKKEVIS